MEKTKVMEMRKGETGSNLNAGDDSIEVARDFNYLGSKVND